MFILSKPRYLYVVHSNNATKKNNNNKNNNIEIERAQASVYYYLLQVNIALNTGRDRFFVNSVGFQTTQPFPPHSPLL